MTEYYSLVTQSMAGRHDYGYSPMDRFLEEPQFGHMEKLVESTVLPPSTGERRKRKLRNRRIASTVASMAVEAPVSERSLESQ